MRHAKVREQAFKRAGLWSAHRSGQRQSSDLRFRQRVPHRLDERLPRCPLRPDTSSNRPGMPELNA
jgi:hypothetical protein